MKRGRSIPKFLLTLALVFLVQCLFQNCDSGFNSLSSQDQGANSQGGWDSCPITTAPIYPSSKRILYVDSSDGDDSRDGLTAASAWRTLKKAGDLASAGDLVLLKGSFLDEQLTPRNSGTLSERIVFKSAPGQVAKLSKRGISISSKSYIVIDGLEMTDIYFPYATIILSSSNNISVRNMNIHDTSRIGIYDGSYANRIEDNVFSRCGPTPTDPQVCAQDSDPAKKCANDGNYSCILMNSTANTKNIITRNKFNFSNGPLMVLNGGPGSIGNEISYNDLSNPWSVGLINFGANQSLIQCNKIHGSSGGTALLITSSDNIIRYNQIYDNKGEGLALRTFPGTKTSRNHIYGNTITGNGGPNIRLTMQYIPNYEPDNMKDNVFENNIFWDNNHLRDGHWYYPNPHSKMVEQFEVVIDMYHSNVSWEQGSLNGNIIRNNINGSRLDEPGNGWFMLVLAGGVGSTFLTLDEAQATYPQNISGNKIEKPVF
ncbi:MAG: hypothetical protein A4S09_12330 [Proteobacteria bacterium SG_bin7]|nr:MAG: hypothetical protein A4S09_12330 [Proteobacteria bacterium SG_bin7]